MKVYKEICRESLAFPLGTRPTDYSRINYDGTPFQFAVTLGSPLRSLQFLSEAGMPGLSGIKRFRANQDCIASLAKILQLNKAYSEVTDLLDELVPKTNVDLLANPGGAFWIGVAFTSAREPKLKIYINASWGSERNRWARLNRFASYFGALKPWQRLEKTLMPDMNPLGVALTLSRESRPTGRIYLSTYGKHVVYFEELAKSIMGENFKNILKQYAEYILGADYSYPTQTTVCSFGLGAGPLLDFKFELCGHCLFANDVEAVSRMQAYFEATNIDPSSYFDVLATLSEGHLSKKTTDLHCYVGIGLKQDSPYFTIYLKPKLLITDEY